jgi:hypothetical protein
MWLVLTRMRRLQSFEEVLLVAGLAAPMFSLAAFWVVGTNTTSSPNAPYFWFASGALAFWLCAAPGTSLQGRTGRAPAPAGGSPGS